MNNKVPNASPASRGTAARRQMLQTGLSSLDRAATIMPRPNGASSKIQILEKCKDLAAEAKKLPSVGAMKRCVPACGEG